MVNSLHLLRRHVWGLELENKEMGMAKTDNPGMGAIWDKGLVQPEGQDSWEV